VSDPFSTYGPPELCTWRYGHGTCRFQTTSPKFARKLSQRRGAGLVGWSVTNNYLRIFEEKIVPWRARRLVIRYLKPTNGGFLSDKSPPKLPKTPSRVVTAGRLREPFIDPLRSQNTLVFTARGDLSSESKAQGRVRL
jgi:hypothetical protein